MVPRCSLLAVLIIALPGFFINPAYADPIESLILGQKRILNEFWTSWISFREYNGLLVYFSHLVSYRCAIKEVRYGINSEVARDLYVIPPCDPDNLYTIPPSTLIYRTIPPSTKMMSVKLIYTDGEESETRIFSVPQ